jgi:hypothetical protein
MTVNSLFDVHSSEFYTRCKIIISPGDLDQNEMREPILQLRISPGKSFVISTLDDPNDAFSLFDKLNSYLLDTLSCMITCTI